MYNGSCCSAKRLRKETDMSKLVHFQCVDYCHAMHNHGWSVEVIASRLEWPVEAVKLALESSPIGSSPHG